MYTYASYGNTDGDQLAPFVHHGFGGSPPVMMQHARGVRDRVVRNTLRADGEFYVRTVCLPNHARDSWLGAT